jgi:hypothetical protein
MAITTTWLIEQMNCYPIYEGQTNVVFTVCWRVNAVDGTYNATSYGTMGVVYDAGASYTPYEQLAQDQVVGWVKAAMLPGEADAIEIKLASEIANQVNPPIITLTLPWVS